MSTLYPYTMRNIHDACLVTCLSLRDQGAGWWCGEEPARAVRHERLPSLSLSPPPLQEDAVQKQQQLYFSACVLCSRLLVA